jgi:hypothetical protein
MLIGTDLTLRVQPSIVRVIKIDKVPSCCCRRTALRDAFPACQGSHQLPSGAMSPLSPQQHMLCQELLAQRKRSYPLNKLCCGFFPALTISIFQQEEDPVRVVFHCGDGVNNYFHRTQGLYNLLFMLNIQFRVLKDSQNPLQ